MRIASGFDFKTEIVGRRLGDVPDLTADPAYAEKELGFRAPQDLVTMCHDLWNWQSRNPEGYSGPSVEPKNVNGTRVEETDVEMKTIEPKTNGFKKFENGASAAVEDVVGAVSNLKGTELKPTAIVSESK
jgi:aldose 1-epimerase